MYMVFVVDNFVMNVRVWNCCIIDVGFIWVFVNVNCGKNFRLGSR